jgi:hypothetical protein
VTPFTTPLAALFLVDPDKGSWEPVAIIAMDDEEYHAVDERGQTVAGIHFRFSIVDPDVRHAIHQARWSDGS